MKFANNTTVMHDKVLVVPVEVDEFSVKGKKIGEFSSITVFLEEKDIK